MRKRLHRLKHILGWYSGTVESFYIENDLYIGYKCSECGEINHAQITRLGAHIGKLWVK